MEILFVIPFLKLMPMGRDKSDPYGSLLFGRSSGPPALTAFFTNFGIEFRALLAFSRLAAFFANLSVKLRSPFLLYGFTTLFADFGIKFGPVLLSHSLTAMLSLLRSRLWSAFVIRH